MTWAVDTNEQTDDAGGDVEGGDVEGGDVKDGEVKDGEVKDGEVKDGEVKDGEVKDGEVEEGEPVGAAVDGDREFETSADGAPEHPRRTTAVTKNVTTRRTRLWSGRQRCVRFSGVHLLVDSRKSRRDPE